MSDKEFAISYQWLVYHLCVHNVDYPRHVRLYQIPIWECMIGFPSNLKLTLSKLRATYERLDDDTSLSDAQEKWRQGTAKHYLGCIETIEDLLAMAFRFWRLVNNGIVKKPFNSSTWKPILSCIMDVRQKVCNIRSDRKSEEEIREICIINNRSNRKLLRKRQKSRKQSKT